MQKYKKLDLLNPLIKETKIETSFTKFPRPELFPVKDEHSAPPNYDY